MKRDIKELVKLKYKAKNKWYEKGLDMSLSGASLTEICQEIGLAKSTLYHKRRTEPEFEEQVQSWLLAAEAWFNKTGRINLDNKSFSYQGFKMQMVNRFGWDDSRASIDITSGGETISLPPVTWVTSDEDTED